MENREYRNEILSKRSLKIKIKLKSMLLKIREYKENQIRIKDFIVKENKVL